MSTTDRGPSMVQLVVAASERTGDPRLAQIDDTELERLVRVGAAELAAQTCRWLEFVAELTVRGIWADQGFTTPATWLAWAVSMGPSTAREHVRVALSLPDWPTLHERFAGGEISFSKVRAITRYGDPRAERLLLQYAEHADGAQLERILRSFDTYAPSDVDERPVFERRHVSFRELDLDQSELTLVAPTEVVLEVLHAIDRAAEVARREDRQAATAAAEEDGVEPVEVEPIGAYRADALVASVGALADGLPVDASGGDRHTIVWHVQATDAEPAGDAEDGQVVDAVPVHAATRRGNRSRSMSPKALARLACGAGMVAALHDDEGALEAMSGRVRRVPPKMLRALRTRDRRCRYPGCGNTRWVDAHHIIEVANGGRTQMDNLVLLCVRHHHVVHDRNVTIVHDGRGRMRFVLADGRRLEPSPQLPTASAEARSPQAVDGAERDPRMLQPTGYQRRIDLAACVEALMQELDLLHAPVTRAA